MSIFRAPAELPEDLLDACESILNAKLQSVLIDSTYAVRMALFVFRKFAIYELVVTFGVPLRFILYYLIINRYCTGFAFLILIASCEE